MWGLQLTEQTQPYKACSEKCNWISSWGMMPRRNNNRTQRTKATYPQCLAQCPTWKEYFDILTKYLTNKKIWNCFIQMFQHLLPVTILPLLPMESKVNWLYSSMPSLCPIIVKSPSPKALYRPWLGCSLLLHLYFQQKSHDIY